MIGAVIFDMDGILIDSEPLWRAVEVEVFGSIGVPLTEEEAHATTGLRTDDVVRYRLRGRRDVDPGEIEARILDRLVDEVSRRGQPMRGAREAVGLVQRMGLRLALASSSPDRVIEAALQRLGLAGSFEVVHSAESEPYGKPHPAVYLTTAARLDVPPERCVAIEDSVRGMIAAKAASMACIAVPERADPRFALADLTLGSLLELDAATLERLG